MDLCNLEAFCLTWSILQISHKRVTTGDGVRAFMFAGGSEPLSRPDGKDNWVISNKLMRGNYL